MGMLIVMQLNPPNLNNYSPIISPTSLLCRRNTGHFFKPLNCAPLDQQQSIMCEPCNGKGWLLCDFCNGQKTNVRADNKRIYRRCPSCRAIGYVLCSNCKVFKCVTFPSYIDGDD